MPFILAEKPRAFNTSTPSYILVKSKSNILTHKVDNRIFFNSEELELEESDKASLLYIGQLHQKALYALEKDSLSSLGRDYRLASDIMDLLNPEELTAFYRSAYLLNWNKTSQFCGCCGGITQLSETEFVKSCRTCNHQLFPQYSPAINVLVIRDNQLLLGRSPQFKKGMYSPLAGFIEAGETPIDAVHRELWEETKIKVRNVRPFESVASSWPFPNTLLLGFLAEYDSGELTPNLKEIEDARWFHYSNLPDLPIKASISYHLIQAGIKLCKDNDSPRHPHNGMPFKKNFHLNPSENLNQNLNRLENKMSASTVISHVSRIWYGVKHLLLGKSDISSTLSVQKKEPKKTNGHTDFSKEIRANNIHTSTVYVGDVRSGISNTLGKFNVKRHPALPQCPHKTNASGLTWLAKKRRPLTGGVGLALEVASVAAAGAASVAAVFRFKK